MCLFPLILSGGYDTYHTHCLGSTFLSSFRSSEEERSLVDTSSNYQSPWQTWRDVLCTANLTVVWKILPTRVWINCWCQEQHDDSNDVDHGHSLNLNLFHFLPWFLFICNKPSLSHFNCINQAFPTHFSAFQRNQTAPEMRSMALPKMTILPFENMQNDPCTNTCTQVNHHFWHVFPLFGRF